MSLLISYDSSFDGFLSAVFEIYRQRLDVGDFLPERPYDRESSATFDLFLQPFHVETVADSARRLRRAIVNMAGADILELLETAFRSEERGVEMKILAFLRKLFAGDEVGYARNPTSTEMLPLFMLARAVRHESGGMLGMVRFNKAPDGLYVAEIEPKYDILEMIVGHFRGRFPTGRWAIVDVMRCYGVFYDGHDTEYLEFADPDTLTRTIAQNAPPDEFTRMWKSYYDSMAIKERLNPRLLRRCLPVRYWKHLPERQQNLAGPASYSAGRPTNSSAGGSMGRLPTA